MGLEYRLRGLDSLGRVGRQQRQAAERGLDAAAQAVVEADGSGAVGNAGDRRAGRRVDHLAVCLREINSPGVGIGHQPAVLKRADNGVGKRIAAGGDHADSFVGIGKLVICEFTDRVLERPRDDRQRGCKNQQ